MSNTRITISAQEDGSVQSTMSRLRQSAAELGRQMIQDASQQASSGKDMVRIIEEQIRTIQRRNALSQSERRFELDDKLDKGEIKQRKYDREIDSLDSEKKEDDLQIQLLRDLIETIKEEARDQVRSDRDIAEDNVQQIRQGVVQEDDLDPEEVLKRRLQSDAIPETKPDEEEFTEEDTKRGPNTRALVGYGQQSLNNVVNSPNEVYALAAFIGMLPVIGGAISSLVGKTLTESTQLATARGRLNSLTGDDTGNIGFGAASFGVTSAEFMEKYAMQYARAAGRFQNVEQGGLDIGRAERSLGVSDQSLTQLIRNLRQSDNKDFVVEVGRLVQSLQNRDVTQVNDFTQIEEYLGIANNLTSQQNQILDRVDVGINSAMIAELAKLGGSFSNPEALRGIIQTLNGGVQNPSTPYAQAMQFAVMSRMNPTASRFELMEMQEKGIQDPRILEGVLNQLSQASGPNQDLFNEQIKAYFPQLSYSQASRLGRSYMSGQLQLPQEADEVDPQRVRDFVRGRANENTASLTARTASIDNILATKGEQISAEIAKLADTFGGIDGAVGGILDTGIDILAAINKIIGFFGGSELPMTKNFQSNKIHSPTHR